MATMFSQDLPGRAPPAGPTGKKLPQNMMAGPAIAGLQAGYGGGSSRLMQSGPAPGGPSPGGFGRGLSGTMTSGSIDPSLPMGYKDARVGPSYPVAPSPPPVAAPPLAPTTPTSPSGGGGLGGGVVEVAPPSEPEQVMTGLQMAGPEPQTAGFQSPQLAGMINPRLGQRVMPNAYSGLKALVY